MSRALILLAALVTLSAGVRAQGFDEFLAANPLYSFISDGVPDVLGADQGYTIFIPLLNNVTGPQAAAFPQLSPNLVLPYVYGSPSELLAAGAVTNLANVTITLEDNPGAGVIDATFVELGASAQIYPVAFPVGKSVLYPMTVLSSGDVAQSVNAEAPAPSS